ncbi:MAG: calcium/sodium antiporter [Parvularculaceae bacterium]|nr:calcium/sodium antiporter [Parvularculaceae bacterium]
MAAEFALIVLGLAVILVAGDLLVRGAVSLATAFSIPTLIVSLTIVAFGTSAPEFFVAVRSVLDGHSGLAEGSIVGSNIANMLLVLGVPALIFPISAKTNGLRQHAIALLIATAAFAAAAYLLREVDEVTGAALFAGIIVYVGYMWWRATHGEKDDPVVDEVEEYADDKKLSANTFLYILGGVVGLPIGAGLLTSHGAALAETLGARQEIIGLGLLALGTSLPELATVLAAAFRKKSDVAMGGAIGSNVFNILAVGGASGLAGGFGFATSSLVFDIPVMLGATAFVALFALTRRDIGRSAGLLMTAAYFAFLTTLVLAVGAD